LVALDGVRSELGAIVEPGASRSLLADVAAPATPGRYTLQWELLREGVRWYGPPSSGAREHDVIVDEAAPAWQLVDVDVAATVRAGETSRVAVTLRNTSSVAWEPARGDVLSYRWRDLNGQTIVADGLRTALPARVAPGEAVTLEARVRGPDATGPHELALEPLREGVRWYGPPASRPRVVIDVAAAELAWRMGQLEPQALSAASEVEVPLQLINVGAARFTPEAGDRLGYHIAPAGEPAAAREGPRTALPGPLEPGATLEVAARLVAPLEPGRYRVTFAIVREGVAWYAPERGGEVEVEVGPPALAWEPASIDAPFALTVSRTESVTVTLKNTGTAPWSSESGDHLSYHWLDEAGDVVVFDGLRTPLPEVVAPGERVTVAARVKGPPGGGRHLLQFDMVREQVAWFATRSEAPPRPVPVWILWSAALEQLGLLLVTLAFALAVRRAWPKVPVEGRAWLSLTPVVWAGLATLTTGLTFAELGGHELWPGAMWLSISSAALPALAIASLPARARLPAALAWVSLYSLLTAADLLYMHFCGGIVPVQALVGSSQLADVTASVGASLDRSFAWLLPAPLTGVALLLLWPRDRGAPPRPLRRRVTLWGLSLALALSLPISCRLRAVMTSELGHRVFSEQRNVGRLGLLGAHLFDVLRTARERVGAGAATPAEEAAIRTWYEGQASQRAAELAALTLPPRERFGAYQGANLLVIQVESLQGWVVGAEVDGQEITPFLNRLRGEARYFPRFVDETAQGMTSDAEYATLNSNLPMAQGALVFLRPGNDFLTLAHVLAAHGYATLSAHPYRRGFWNRATIHPRYGFERSLFRRELGDGMVVGWGLADGLFFERILPELEALPRPFFAFLVTLSVHHPYDAVPEAIQELALGELAGTPLGNYLQGMRYADRSLAWLIDQLEARGLLADTIVAIYGDHDARLGDGPEIRELAGVRHWSPAVPLLLERVPAFVIAPRGADGERPRGPVDAVGSHVDMAPTLLHYLGVPAPRSFLGRPLLPGARGFAALPDGSARDDARVHVEAGEAGEAGGCFDDAGRKRPRDECEALARRAREALRSSRQLLDFNLARRIAER
ncbi:MAG: sulfatase-like hydrolase/transferase, partial [Myxococcales bacterium]|nr:sulfatase-like hydrolase/transferase [Myxococcales bacterium]